MRHFDLRGGEVALLLRALRYYTSSVQGTKGSTPDATIKRECDLALDAADALTHHLRTGKPRGRVPE